MPEGRKPQKETEFRVANCTYCVAKGSSRRLTLVTECQPVFSGKTVTSLNAHQENVRNKRSGPPLHAIARVRHLIAFHQNLLLEIIHGISFWVS